MKSLTVNVQGSVRKRAVWLAVVCSGVVAAPLVFAAPPKPAAKPAAKPAVAKPKKSKALQETFSPGAFQPGGKRKKGSAMIYLPGESKKRLVTYDIVEGIAVFQGDVVLGPEQEVAKRYAQPRLARKGGKEARGVARSDAAFLWPNATIPYEIRSDMPAKKKAEIEEAARRFAAKTVLRLRPKTAADKDWVEFFYNGASGGCWSYLGRVGGKQLIAIPEWCPTGSIQHETMHAAGFFHEQSRNDRDDYITVVFDNIDPDMRGNFEKAGSDGKELTPYDYGSIMHYGAYGFSINGEPTIVPKKAGVEIGQREALSALDIQSLAILYANELPAQMTLSCQFVSGKDYKITAQLTVPSAHAGVGKAATAQLKGGSSSKVESVQFDSGARTLGTVTADSAPNVTATLKPADGAPLTGTVQCTGGGGSGKPDGGVTPPVTPPSTGTLEPGPMDGVYDSAFGEVRCKESFSSLKCEYRLSRDTTPTMGKLDCSIRNKQSLTCRWSEGTERGRAKFDRMAGGTLVGTWGRKDDKDGGDWNLNRKVISYPKSPTWVKVEDPTWMPHGAVVVGKTYSGEIHLCRATIEGVAQPGKVERGRCVVLARGKTEKVDVFETLVIDPEKSEFVSSAGAPPSGAVTAGTVPDNRIVVCRTTGYSKAVGKVVDGACLVGGGYSVKLETGYEILTSK